MSYSLWTSKRYLLEFVDAHICSHRGPIYKDYITLQVFTGFYPCKSLKSSFHQLDRLCLFMSTSGVWMVWSTTFESLQFFRIFPHNISYSVCNDNFDLGLSYNSYVYSYYDNSYNTTNEYIFPKTSIRRTQQRMVETNKNNTVHCWH